MRRGDSIYLNLLLLLLHGFDFGLGVVVFEVCGLLLDEIVLAELCGLKIVTLGCVEKKMLLATRPGKNSRGEVDVGYGKGRKESRPPRFE